MILLGFAILLLGTLKAQFVLPQLPYNYGALEPYIDSATMYIHLNSHHQAYINNLNKALEKEPSLSNKTIIDLMRIHKLPKNVQIVIRNNGGSHYNHSLFWTILAPANSTTLKGELEDAIVKQFGSVDAFKKEFEQAGLGRFGSGWAWLVVDKNGALKIGSTPNQDNPLMDISELKGTPILCNDVWEHAYYLKYQSKRASYLQNFWNVVNWDKVSEYYKIATLSLK